MFRSKILTLALATSAARAVNTVPRLHSLHLLNSTGMVPQVLLSGKPIHARLIMPKAATPNNSTGATPSNASLLNASAGLRGAAPLMFHLGSEAAAHGGSCGDNTLEVEEEAYATIMQQATMVDYLCKCGKMNVKTTLYIDDGKKQLNIGTTTKTFEEKDAEKLLCQVTHHMFNMAQISSLCTAGFVGCHEASDLCIAHTGLTCKTTCGPHSC